VVVGNFGEDDPMIDILKRHKTLIAQVSLILVLAALLMMADDDAVSKVKLYNFG
jgi:hypothetical protein